MLKPIGELTGTAPAPTFDMWWGIYPRKQGSKAKIRKKFNDLSAADRSACYLGTGKHVETNPQWRDKQFIPMPATFLNGERWNDEIIATKREVMKERAEESGDMIEFVWLSMVEMYGEQWIKTHGEKPGELWVKFLRPLSAKRIRRGMRCTLDRNKEFPPSLPAFLGYCSATFDEQHPPALPKPAGDPNIALQAIAAMKKILGGAK